MYVCVCVFVSDHPRHRSVLLYFDEQPLHVAAVVIAWQAAAHTTTLRRRTVIQECFFILNYFFCFSKVVNC